MSKHFILQHVNLVQKYARPECISATQHGSSGNINRSISVQTTPPYQRYHPLHTIPPFHVLTCLTLDLPSMKIHTAFLPFQLLMKFPPSLPADVISVIAFVKKNLCPMLPWPYSYFRLQKSKCVNWSTPIWMIISLAVSLLLPVDVLRRPRMGYHMLSIELLAYVINLRAEPVRAHMRLN